MLASSTHTIILFLSMKGVCPHHSLARTLYRLSGLQPPSGGGGQSGFERTQLLLGARPRPLHSAVHRHAQLHLPASQHRDGGDLGGLSRGLPQRSLVFVLSRREAPHRTKVVSGKISLRPFMMSAEQYALIQCMWRSLDHALFERRVVILRFHNRSMSTATPSRRPSTVCSPCRRS